MIRVLLGSVVALGGLGLAAVYAGPDLVTGSNGAPMIVDGGSRASLQAALFDGGACASTLLYGEKPATGAEADGIRIVALGLRADGEVVELGIRDTPGANGAPRATVALLFDEDGTLVGISKPEAFSPAATLGDCPSAPEQVDGAPI
jgi:hypothetical protein